MQCSKVAQQLQLYIDKQLTLPQIRAIEEHISSCHTCQHELLLLEEMDQAFRTVMPVPEPGDLTENIMRRVALSKQYEKERKYALLRPSLAESLAVILLATFTTLGIIWQQPTLREALPFGNGHDLLSSIFDNIDHMLMNMNSGTLLMACWVFGTILGVWITLVLLGAEMRKNWFKAMMDRLPVH